MCRLLPTKVTRLISLSANDQQLFFTTPVCSKINFLLNLVHVFDNIYHDVHQHLMTVGTIYSSNLSLSITPHHLETFVYLNPIFALLLNCWSDFLGTSQQIQENSTSCFRIPGLHTVELTHLCMDNRFLVQLQTHIFYHLGMGICTGTLYLWILVFRLVFRILFW